MRRNRIQSNSGRSFDPVSVSRGGVPIESAPLIEDVLSQSIARAIYDSSIIREKFDELNIELLDFGGGEYAISLPMLLEVSVKDLSRVVVDTHSDKRLGVRGAANLKSKLRSVMKQEPYY